MQPFSSSSGRIATLVAAAALAAGVAIGYVDSRPTWDDTGVTVAALLLAAGLLGALRPRSWWITALLVGAPVPIFNYVLHGNLQATVAMIFAFVGAGIGAAVGRLVFVHGSPDARV